MLILQTEDRNKLNDSLMSVNEIVISGLTGRSVFLSQAGLDKFRNSIDLTGSARAFAGALIKMLEQHGFLEEHPTHHAVGSLCEYMIEHIPEQPQRDKQFLAELVVKYV